MERLSFGKGSFSCILNEHSLQSEQYSIMDFFDVFWSLNKYWNRGEKYGRKYQQLSFRCRKILS